MFLKGAALHMLRLTALIEGILSLLLRGAGFPYRKPQPEHLLNKHQTIIFWSSESNYFPSKIKHYSISSNNKTSCGSSFTFVRRLSHTKLGQVRQLVDLLKL